MRVWDNRWWQGAALALALAALSRPAAAQSVPGDVTGDGRLGVTDAVMILQFVAGTRSPSGAEAAQADITGDGRVDILDVITILRVAAGLQAPPEPPPPPPPPPGLTGTTLQANVVYAGGTRLQAPWAGVGFAIPADFQGGLDGSDQTFYIQSTTRANVIGMVLAAATLPNKPTPQSVSELVGQPIDLGSGVVLQPEGTPSITGSRVSGTFRASTFLGPVVAVGLAEVSPLGSSLAVLVAGPEAERDYLRKTAEDVIGSAAFAVPQNQQWWDLMAGYTWRLTRSTYDPSGSTSSDTFFNLCPEGRFTYRYHSFVSTPAGSVESEDRKAGTWLLGIDLYGPGLVLYPNDNSDSISYRLQSDGQRVYADQIELAQFNGEPCL